MIVKERKMLDIYLEDDEEFDFNKILDYPYSSSLYVMNQDRIVLHYPDGKKFVYKDRSGLFNV